MNDDPKLTFVQESEDLLAEMEDALLAMEQSPDDEEHLNCMFRAMHTIKGAAGIFGFKFIVDFTHPVETELDHVRSGERTIDSDLIALLLESKDYTADLVQAVANDSEDNIEPELEERGQEILNRLVSGSDNSMEVIESNSHIEPELTELMPTDNWMISLHFKDDAFRNGLDPLSFIRYLPRVGDVIDIASFSNRIPEVEKFDPETCYMSYIIALNSSASKEDIESVFEFAFEDCDIKLHPPQSKHEEYLQLLDEFENDELERIGEILVQIGAITHNELVDSLNAQDEHIDTMVVDPQVNEKPIGEILVDRNSVSQPVLDKALKKQEEGRTQKTKEAQFIRVDARRLGQLINLVGELVISNAAVKLMVDRYNMHDVNEVVTGVENLVEEIRDHALQLRMVQIGDTFSRFRRVVRDVSKELDKKIDLVITGGEAELDKTVVEKINDPLTHLVRNSLDHGIETPEQRLAAGKPETGVLRLNALHDSGHIVIQIADDGAGLDTEKIRAKAEAIGLIKPDQVLTQRELLRLTFEPGLSTKEQASNLSGRGVGMDVVKRNIEALRGTVELDSERGKGTLVTIHLPLTLAIIDGFMVGASNERYVIPLSMVEECVEMHSEDWELDETRHYVNLRGDVMPYLRLTEFFDIPTVEDRIQRESLVVVRFGRTRAGLVVDELFGELQTVIKPLGKVFQHLKGVSGATVLGSGEIALILDVQGLIGMASENVEAEQGMVNHG